MSEDRETGPAWSSAIWSLVRLARSTIRRKSRTDPGARAEIEDLIDQLALRAGLIASSTWRTERYSLLAYLRHSLDTDRRDGMAREIAAHAAAQKSAGRKGAGRPRSMQYRSAEIDLIAGVLIAGTKADPGRLQRALAHLEEMGESEAIARGSALLRHHAAIEPDRMPDAADEIEALHHDLAGTRPNMRRKGSQEFRPVSGEEVHAICRILRRWDGDPHPVALLKGERPEYPGLVAALMFEAMWLIGLRSVECLQCALMLKVDGGFRTVEDLVETVSPPPAEPGLTLRQIQERAIDHALEEILGTDSEPILFVITAKSAPTRQKGLPVIRQIHVGGLSFASKQNLFYLSMLRGMGLEGREMANFMRDMRYRIRRASEKVLGRGEFVTPHDARRDFADRARAIFTRAELMALLGHAGPRSLEQYGRKRRRQGSGGRGAVAVCPDPDHVELIRRTFGLDGSLDRMLDPQDQPEPVDEEAAG